MVLLWTCHHIQTTHTWQRIRICSKAAHPCREGTDICIIIFKAHVLCIALSEIISSCFVSVSNQLWVFCRFPICNVMILSSASQNIGRVTLSDQTGPKVPTKASFTYIGYKSPRNYFSWGGGKNTICNVMILSSASQNIGRVTLSDQTGPKVPTKASFTYIGYKSPRNYFSWGGGKNTIQTEK